MNKEIIELLEKALKRLGQYREPPVIRAGEHPLKFVYDNIDQALTKLRKVPEQPPAGEQLIIVRPRRIGKMTEWVKQLRPEVKIEESDCQKQRADLLTACERMLGAMRCDELNNGRVFNDDLRKEVKKQAEAAIAKAKKEG